MKQKMKKWRELNYKFKEQTNNLILFNQYKMDIWEQI